MSIELNVPSRLYMHILRGHNRQKKAAAAPAVM